MLRNLIMGLLLANVLLFIWGRWILAPEVPDPRVFGDAAGPQLVLVERPDRPDRTGRVAVQGDRRCFRLGPFSSIEAATAVSSRLSAKGLPVNRTSESGQIWVGHWVQLPDLPGVEEARQAVKALKRGGIGDAYIFQSEPTVDISLGVFRGRPGADDVIRIARNLGYEPVTSDRFKDGIEHWVGVETPVDQPPNLADLRVRLAQIVRIDERPCGSPLARVRDSNGDGAADSLESRAREDGLPEAQTLPE